MDVPDGQDRITAFRDAVAPSYKTPDNVATRVPPGTPAGSKRFARCCRPRPARILDVGTGTGFAAGIAAELGHQVTAIDLCEGMLEASAARRRGLAITFAVDDAVGPAFPAESFGVVLSRSLLWTLRKPGRAFRNCYELLKPGGRVVAIYGLSPAGSVPLPDDDTGPEPNLFERHYTPGTRAALTAMHLSDHQSLRQMAAAAGFRVGVTSPEMVRGWETSPGSEPPYALLGYR